MPVRATKRGAERTQLKRDCDVLVCGASFAGLAIARELADTGARVLVIDRYEIGVRHPHRLAHRARAGGIAAPNVRRAGRAHAVDNSALEAAMDVLDVRLSRA